MRLCGTTNHLLEQEIGYWIPLPIHKLTYLPAYLYLFTFLPADQPVKGAGNNVEPIMEMAGNVLFQKHSHLE